MDWLPTNYEQSWTLANRVSREGVGLHSGEISKVNLLPSIKPGFHLSWIDNSTPPTTLNPNQVVHSQLCTTLLVNEEKIATVEHLFAALVGCGITHVHIQLSGNEIPLLDGSSLGWVEAIQEAHLRPADSKRAQVPVVKQPFIINRGESLIALTPFDGIKFVVIIDFPYSVIGKQIFSIDLSPKTFVREVAPARTFGFKDQVETLIKAGLIKGGSLENSLVCDDSSWLNPPLRFDNEPVRHKLLDLIGDLALVGLPKAQILVYRGSHALHSDLASLLQKNSSLAAGLL